MLYIRPYTSEDQEPDLLALREEGKLAYLAYAGKERIGCVIYHMEEEMLCIESVDAQEEALFDGLIRAVCDAAVQSEISAVRFEENVDRRILKNLGVPIDSEGILHEISAFLHNCSHCKLC
ncbi:MAG: hypothetical protein ACOX6P_00700 [Candidatus Merdivicinus sp.]|jgi:hypothetical protein